MVKINGIELKNVKTFGGMEGNGFNATVYLNDKKVGKVEDHGFGAGYEFDIIPGAEKEFKKAIGKIDTEVFIGKIMDLITLEKAFKKAAKKYTNAVIIGLYQDGSFLGRYYLVGPKDIQGTVAEEQKKKIQCRVLRSLNDFNVVM